MSTLFAMLSNSARSLSAHQVSVATAQNNLANVNTPGFARQSVVLTASEGSTGINKARVGQGVDATAVVQARDRFLDAQVSPAVANASQHRAAADALSNIVSLNPNNEASIANRIAGFYSSLRLLSQRPGDRAQRTAVIGTGRDLATAIQTSAREIDDARDNIDESVRVQASEVNRLLGSVAELNKKISSARAETGADPNELVDERVRTVEKLSELIGSRAVPDAHGNVNIVIGGGTTLVSGTSPVTISTTGKAADRGHLELLIQPPGSNERRALKADELGGALRGNLDARDGTLAETERSLDQLAFDLGQTVNSVHSNGFAQDGSTGRNFYEVGAEATGAALRINVNQEIADDPTLFAAAGNATAAFGDNGNVLVLLQTEDVPVTGGSNLNSAIGRLTSAFGVGASQSISLADQSETLRDHVLSLRDAASGVSVDEEIIEMTKAQRAFEAMARVIKTANEMMDTLLQIGGR